jgi:protein-tyrosine-phosphatase
MAEGIARGLAGNRFIVASAGVSATGWIAEQTVATLSEMGYPTDGLYSKSLDAIDLTEQDVIVSLIGPEAVRYLPRTVAADLVVWSLRDPYGEEAAVYRDVARQIERKIRTLFDELTEEELPTI